jgi:hypothetical protein
MLHIPSRLIFFTILLKFDLNSISFFLSLQIREVNGKIRKAKGSSAIHFKYDPPFHENTDNKSPFSGCIHTFDTATLYCNTKAHDGKHVHEKYGASGQYSVLCCNHELCNNETDWPVLPDVPFTGKNHSLTSYSFSLSKAF